MCTITYIVRNVSTGETFAGFFSRAAADSECFYLRVVRPGLWDVFTEEQS